MDIEQIKAIISGSEETLRMLQISPDWQNIESSEMFSTQNDLVLGDAIQTLAELYQALDKIQPQRNTFDLLGVEQ